MLILIIVFIITKTQREKSGQFLEHSKKILTISDIVIENQSKGTMELVEHLLKLIVVPFSENSREI